MPGLYADRIFDVYTVLFRAIRNPDKDEEILNRRMNSLRESIELAYGSLFKYFRLLRNKSKIRLLTGKHRAKRLGIVFFFLSNCMTTLRGNHVNSIFNSDYPALEEYLSLDEYIEPFDILIEENDFEN